MIRGLYNLLIRCEENFDIKKLTSFKIGGKIARVYFPENESDFVEVMKKEPQAVVVGNLTNVLVSDGGYSGSVILTSKMDKIFIENNKVFAQCGVKGQRLAQEVAKVGLSGLEFMIGFPGAVGGEVYMNASANGQAVSDNFVKARCYSVSEGVFELNKEEMRFGYRSSICQEKNIKVLGVEFDLVSVEPQKVEARMKECLDFRRSHQPLLNLPNCGSVFKNPVGNSAGKLLDECGVKTFSVGGVRVWENHANFIINDNNGTSQDVLNLMAKMSGVVEEKFGIKLEPEVIYLGDKDKREEELCKKLYQKMQK